MALARDSADRQAERLPPDAASKTASRARPDRAEEGYPFARLLTTPDNPVPEGAHARLVTASDGIRLRAVTFARPAATRGTVLILQGRNEACEKYFETADDLGRRGFGTLAFDWRGQGGSERVLADGHRGHVQSFNDYCRDLSAIIEGPLAESRGPYTLVAHSMGALVALLAAPQLAGRVGRMVLLAPLFNIVERPLGQGVLKWTTGLLRMVGLGGLYAALGPRPREMPDFLTNVLTTDRGRHERNSRILLAHPQLALGGPTIGWLHAALTAMDRATASAHLAKVSVPSLMIAAGDDQVVSTPAIESVAQRLRNGNGLIIDGARHELLQEQDRYREQVLAAIDRFADDGRERRAGTSWSRIGGRTRP